MMTVTLILNPSNLIWKKIYDDESFDMQDGVEDYFDDQIETRSFTFPPFSS